MAEFYFEKYINNYEIDFVNDGTEEERSTFERHNIPSGRYFKHGDEWVKRVSGMTYDIRKTSYYPLLKKYLDHRFNVYLRKMKILKIKSTLGKLK